MTVSPKTIYLNLATGNTSATISVESQCGSITGFTSSNTSLVNVNSSGVVTAVSGSIPYGSKSETKVTVTTRGGCTDDVQVIVKNVKETPPDITISVSGDSSTCSGSYIKGATATVVCRSDTPITSYSAKIGSTSYAETTSGNTKTSTIKLSSTGTKTINVTCSNAEGSSTESKSIKIKVKNASSSCGCSTYYNASTAGSVCGRCTGWTSIGNGTVVDEKDTMKTSCSPYNGNMNKIVFTSCVYPSTTLAKCKYTLYKCTSYACKTYKTCCHT